jgi:hypothetical protein
VLGMGGIVAQSAVNRSAPRRDTVTQAVHQLPVVERGGRQSAALTGRTLHKVV